MKTFSIIIPVYKVAAYVAETVKSVINQHEKDYELIVVDDGSPDNSGSIVYNLLSSSNLDYKVIRTSNRGVSAARNIGLEHSVGEYVIMVDGDDVLSDDFLSNYRELIEAYPGNNIYSTSFTILAGDKVIEQHSVGERIIMYEPQKAQTAFYNRNPRFLLPTMLFRRSFLNGDCKIRFDEKVKYSEDVQFIWRTLAYNVKPVIHSVYSGYNYILHPGSTMTASGVSKIMTWHEGFEKLNEEIQDFLSDEIRDVFVPRGYFSMLHGISQMSSYKKFKEIYDKTCCADKLQFHSANVSKKVKLVAELTILCPRLGYIIMKMF